MSVEVRGGHCPKIAQTSKASTAMKQRQFLDDHEDWLKANRKGGVALHKLIHNHFGRNLDKPLDAVTAWGFAVVEIALPSEGQRRVNYCAQTHDSYPAGDYFGSLSARFVTLHGGVPNAS
jgi:hypothetical protein